MTDLIDIATRAPRSKRGRKPTCDQVRLAIGLAQGTYSGPQVRDAIKLESPVMWAYSILYAAARHHMIDLVK